MGKRDFRRMRATIGAATLLVMIVLVALTGRIEGQSSALPLHFSSGCELDLNGDGKQDRAILIGSSEELELIVLLKTASGYQGVVVAKRSTPSVLTCQYGGVVRERRNRDGSAGQAIKTPGTYLELSQPEGATAAYVWSKGKFLEAWLTD